MYHYNEYVYGIHVLHVVLSHITILPHCIYTLHTLCMHRASNGGKTTLAQKLLENHPLATLIQQDNFYKVHYIGVGMRF